MDKIIKKEYEGKHLTPKEIDALKKYFSKEEIKKRVLKELNG